MHTAFIKTISAVPSTDEAVCRFNGFLSDSSQKDLRANWFGPITARMKPLHIPKWTTLIGFLTSAFLLVGCATPDLKPFGDASKTLAASVKQGGELAIKPLATVPIWDPTNAVWVQPASTNHPYVALEEFWVARRKAMDAIQVYSASLVAISDAAAHRKENAAALVGSVQKLASAVPYPGFSTFFKEGGALVVEGLGLAVEVKAWHDMRRAVTNADPAIQLVARGLKKDFEALALQFQAPLDDQRAKFNDDIRVLARHEAALRAKREGLRGAVPVSLDDAAKTTQMTHIETLYATAAAELEKARAARANMLERIAQGREFFASASSAVDAWAAAHTELARAFNEEHLPNFALLAARAEELKEIVDQLKTKSTK